MLVVCVLTLIFFILLALALLCVLFLGQLHLLSTLVVLLLHAVFLYVVLDLLDMVLLSLLVPIVHSLNPFVDELSSLLIHQLIILVGNALLVSLLVVDDINDLFVLIFADFIPPRVSDDIVLIFNYLRLLIVGDYPTLLLGKLLLLVLMILLLLLVLQLLLILLLLLFVLQLLLILLLLQVLLLSRIFSHDLYLNVLVLSDIFSILFVFVMLMLVNGLSLACFVFDILHFAILNFLVVLFLRLSAVNDLSLWFLDNIGRFHSNNLWLSNIHSSRFRMDNLWLCSDDLLNYLRLRLHSDNLWLSFDYLWLLDPNNLWLCSHNHFWLTYVCFSADYLWFSSNDTRFVCLLLLVYDLLRLLLIYDLLLLLLLRHFNVLAVYNFNLLVNITVGILLAIFHLFVLFH